MEVRFSDAIQRLGLSNFSGDFEDMISYIYSRYPWKSDAHTHDLLAFYFRCIEHLVGSFAIYERAFFDSVVKKEALSSAWDKIFTDFSKNNRAIISLNYDTLVESIIYNYTLTEGPSATLKKYNDVPKCKVS